MKHEYELTMKRKELIFKVFISSTFSDFIEERNALQKTVFPALEKHCAQKGAKFQPVDLRWGISEEAALDQQTMAICLGELQRCQAISPKPNFILLLGQRYGWIPLPSRILSEEFIALRAEIKVTEDRDLLWKDDQEVKAWPLTMGSEREGWYREDRNANPPVYVLQARRRDESFCKTEDDFKQLRHTESEDWKQLEQRIHSVFAEAIVALGWDTDDERREKYEQSATHQEIVHGALNVIDAERHVLTYIRKITPDKPSSETDPALAGFIDNDEGAKERLGRLENQIRKRTPNKVRVFDADWDSTAFRIGDPQNRKGQPCGHIDDFCKAVEADLKGLIEAEIASYSELQPAEREWQAHCEFGIERCADFQGRQNILRDVLKYIEDSDQRLPLVLFGESGCGKSAIMAKMIGELGGYTQVENQKEAATLVYRFIAATPESSSFRGLLASLCSEFGVEDVPLEIKDLKKAIYDRLSKSAPAGQRTILFLDALDQLGHAEQAAMLDWIPSVLGSGVKVVLSTLEIAGMEGMCCQKAKALWPQSCIHLGRLESEAVKSVLDAWLRDAERKLTDSQLEYIQRNTIATGNPLYMKLAFERVRFWTHLVASPSLENSVEGIIAEMLGDLELERRHGRVLVEHALAAIAASKQGLAESELLDILSADSSVMRDFRRRSPESPDVDRLPGIIWSRLFADLRPYMACRRVDAEMVLGFYHRQIGETVCKRYLSPQNSCDVHKRLLNYYSRLWGEMPKSCQLMLGRAAKGIAYHAWRSLSHSSNELETKLLEPALFDAWAGCGYVHELLEDLHGTEPLQPALEGFLCAWQSHALWLVRFPDMASQTIYGAMINYRGAKELLNSLGKHLRSRTTSARGYCLRGRSEKNTLEEDTQEPYSLSGHPVGKQPFDDHHLFFENSSDLAILNLITKKTSVFPIPVQGATRVAASDENAYIAVGYGLRRPRWIVFDRAGRRLCDSSSYPGDDQDEPLALTFINEETLLVLTRHTLRLIQLPSCASQVEYCDPIFHEVTHCVVSVNQDGALVAIGASSDNGYTVQVLHLCRTCNGETPPWSVKLDRRHAFERSVSHLACNRRYIAVVTVDRQLHLLPAEFNSTFSDRDYSLPKRMIKALCCDERSVYFIVLDESLVYRLNPADGMISVSPELRAAPGDLQLIGKHVFVLTGSLGERLVCLEQGAFCSLAPADPHPTRNHVLSPASVATIRSSPSGNCWVLLFSTQTVGVLNEQNVRVWITPSHCPVNDAAITDDGLVYLLDTEGNVYAANPPYLVSQKRFSAPTGNGTRMFVLDNAIAFIRNMYTSFVDITIYSKNGDRGVTWSNRNLADDVCNVFHDVNTSINGNLLVLLRADNQESLKRLRKIELDTSGRILSDQRMEIDCSSRSHIELAGRYWVIWDKLNHQITLQDVQTAITLPVLGLDQRIGSICRVDICPLTDGQDRLVVYGAHGVQIIGLSALAPTYLLPGCGDNDRIIILDKNKLCCVQSVNYRETFTLI